MQTITIQPRGVEETRSKISGLFAAFREGADEASDAGDGVLGTLKSIGLSAKTWIAGTAVAAVAALTTAIGTATAKAIGFENALNEARKTAGLTDEQFADLQEGLLDVQRELGTSQQELADIAAEAGRLGIESPEKIQEFTRTVALMSEATVASASETAQGLAKISNAFDLPIERAEALGSVINELSNQTVADSSQIIDAMTRVGAAGQQVGLAADQVAGFAATLVDAGINARRAGTGLRTIFTRMVNNSEKLAEQTSLTRQEILQAFEEDGLPAIRKYLEALRELPKAQRAAAIEDIFGVEQSSKVQRLVQNIDALNRQISDAQTEFGEADSLAAEFAATTKDVANEWNRLTAKLSAWLADFGDNFTGFLETILSKLNDIAGSVEELRRDMIDAQQQLTDVQGVEQLVEKIDEAKQGTAEYNDLLKKLKKRVDSAFIVQDPVTGEPVGVRMDALRKKLGLLKKEAFRGTEERRQQGLLKIGELLTEIQQKKQDLDETEAASDEWVDLQNEIQAAREKLNKLTEVLLNQFAEEGQVQTQQFIQFLQQVRDELEATQAARKAGLKDPFDPSARVPFSDGGPLANLKRVQKRANRLFTIYDRINQKQQSIFDFAPEMPEWMQSMKEFYEAAEEMEPVTPDTDQIKRFNKARRRSLELLRKINREEELRNAVSKDAAEHIRRIHDLRDRIGRLTERETTLESELQNMTGERLERGRDLLSRIRDQREELRKQLETQRDLLEAERMRSDVEESEQPPAPAPRETLGGSLGDILLSRNEAERAIQNIKAEMNEMVKGVGIEEDLLEKFGLDVDEFAKRLDKLRGELKRGEIDPETFFKQAQEQFKQFKDQILAVIDAMETLGFISQSEAKAARQALESVGDEAEDSEEKIENVGEGIQDTARLVRGIGDLAGQFGDLSDEAEAAIDSTATVLDNVGRLVELSNKNEGFSNIFSSFSGAVSGIGAILGAAGGLASLISTSYGADDKRQKKMEELRKKIDENVRALKENTEAVLEQARVGENMSRRTLERANELLSQIASSEFGEMSGPKQERLLRRLENLAPMFEGVPDLLSNVEEYFVEEQPVGTDGSNIVDDAFMRQLAREFVLTDATAQDVVDKLYENINVATSQGIGADELRERFGDDFLGIQERLAEIEEQFAQFSDTFSGVIEELNFRRQELGSSFEQLRSVLTDRLPDLGFSEELIGRKAPKSFTEILQSRMEEASRGDLEEIRQKLAESLAGDRDLSFLWQELEGIGVDELLGDVTPSQFEDFLDQLETITDVSQDESETDFSTSAAKARIITEHQANEVVSFLRELVQLGRTQRDLLSTILASIGGEPPESPPAQESSSAPEAPPTSEAPSVPGVGIPAGLQETIAAAEANGFRPPVPTGQRSMKKIVNEGQAVYNISLEINGEMNAERTARKVKKYLDEYLPRG